MDILTVGSKSKPTANRFSLDVVTHFLKHRRYFAMAIISMVAVVLLAVFFLIPQVRAVLSNIEVMKAKQQQLNALKTRTTFLASLDADQLALDIKTLQIALPAYKPVIPLLSSMETIAVDSSVALGKFELNPGKVATEGATSTGTAQGVPVVANVYPLPLKLEVMGEFGNMNLFFQHLDDLIPMVNVASIQFSLLSSSLQNSTTSASYRAEVELQSLYTQNDRAKPADAPLPTMSPADQQIIDKFKTLQLKYTPTVYTGIPRATDSATRNIFE